ncbi:hemoblobin-interacting domain-containing protein, partial [Ancylomarina longa]
MKKYLLLGYLLVISTLIVYSQTPPTLNAATGATVDGNIVITFSDPGSYRTSIQSVSYNNTVLPSGALDLTVTDQIILIPSGDPALQVAGSADVIVVATGFSDATVSQTIGHGAANKLGVTTQPVAPSVNGGVFATQPAITVQDQYGNTCTSDGPRSITAANGDGQSWTLGGTTDQDASSGVLTFSGLTATSNVAVSNAYLTFSTSGLTSINSNTFSLALNSPPAITASGTATVDADFTITFADANGWQSKITSITYGGTDISGAYNTGGTSGEITFTPSASTALQAAGTADFVIVATGFSDATVSQTIGHGSPTKLGVTTQPVAPSVNGAAFAPQPAIAIQDQYDNVCTTDGTRTITAAKADAGNWTLGGTTDQDASSGVLTFSGLTATS